jgi:hypothetical protein
LFILNTSKLSLYIFTVPPTGTTPDIFTGIVEAENGINTPSPKSQVPVPPKSRNVTEYGMVEKTLNSILLDGGGGGGGGTGGQILQMPPMVE